MGNTCFVNSLHLYIPRISSHLLIKDTSLVIYRIEDEVNFESFMSFQRKAYLNEKLKPRFLESMSTDGNFSNCLGK